MNTALKPRKIEQKKKNHALVIVTIFFLVFLAFFVYNLIELFTWWNDGRLAHRNTATMHEIFSDHMAGISELSAQIVLDPTPLPQAQPQQPPLELAAANPTFSFNGPSPLDIARSHTGNDDIIAYIFIEGTNINNVVLQTNDNDFYLHHDMYGNPNSNGALFMDFRNHGNFQDPNTIIYGHNMRNGSMFHNIRYFMEPDFFHDHPNIMVIADDRVFIYQIFTSFSTRVDFDYIQVFFNDRAEFYGLIQELQHRAMFPTQHVISQYDHILILSTCTNVHVDSRYVVAGVLRSVMYIE